MPQPQNPFASPDADRHAIWEMLVRRDIEAFVRNDWPRHAADFLKEGFFGIDCGHSDNADAWGPGFPNLDSYAANWMNFAAANIGRIGPENLAAALFDATNLTQIEIVQDFATAHKKFDGWVTFDDGTRERLSWQTLYLCRKRDGRWWISGFVGFMPNPGARKPAKRVPDSVQHKTAGPYSPVLEVNGANIVVISGQVALDLEGRLIAEDFSGQVRATLENCQSQLRAAGCDFADVFKVNAVLTDLGNWAAFNAVYQELMPEPRPVRTTVQAGLLDNFLVEIEMWAVKA